MSEAGVDLDFLRKRGDPGRGAGLEGTILEIGRDPKTNATPTLGMMKGVRVVVEGSGKKWEATTDHEGWFRVWGLPAGEYSGAGRPSAEFRARSYDEEESRGHPGDVRLSERLATPYTFSPAEIVLRDADVRRLLTSRK